MPLDFGLFLFVMFFGFACGRVARWVDSGLSAFLSSV